MKSEIYFSLKTPLNIEESKVDKDVFLYYKQFDKLHYIVVKHTGTEGFLITAYPTEKVKATTNCMFATAKAEKELFLLIWARENYRLLMCFAYFGNLVLQMRK